LILSEGRLRGAFSINSTYLNQVLFSELESVGALEAKDHVRISFNNALNTHDLFAARDNYWLLII
jgi:hypothetical protein